VPCGRGERNAEGLRRRPDDAHQAHPSGEAGDRSDRCDTPHRSTSPPFGGLTGV
jgi:hypothetical protein